MLFTWSFSLLILCTAKQHSAIDEFALVQKTVESPSWQEIDHATGLVTPSRGRQMKVKAAVGRAAKMGLSRALPKTNLTDINMMLNMVKWGLTGKLTEWAMGFYKQPQLPSELDFTDSLILFFSQAFDDSSKTLNNKQMLKRLFDWSKLHGIIEKFHVAKGEPPEVMDAVHILATTIQEKQPANFKEVRTAVKASFANMHDLPMVKLLNYTIEVLQNPQEFSADTIKPLVLAVLKEFGTPEALSSFVLDSIEKKGTGRSTPVRENAITLAYALADSAEELNLPLAVGNFFTKLGSVLSFGGDTEIVLTSLWTKVLELGDLLADIGKALHLPEEMSKLPKGYLRCMSSAYGTEAKEDQVRWGDLGNCMFNLWANASLASGYPPVVMKLLDSQKRLVVRSIKGLQENGTDVSDEVTALKEKGKGLFFESLAEVGYSKQFIDWVKSQDKADEAAHARGEVLYHDKLDQYKLMGQALRFLGVPALAQVVQNGFTMLRNYEDTGVGPLPEAWFRLIMGLIDLPGDMARVKTLNRKVNRRLSGTLIDGLSMSLQEISGGMPDSFLKRSLSKKIQKERPL
mmetsp:Transcript_15186/g.43408  ORF Transcript_15186/g.43408 Transcript_15186/m.43408 type:complete len:573 (+) Transcript_15186:67-1785(+)